MVDIPGLNPIPKNVRANYDGRISRQSVPFDLELCDLLTWAIATAGVLGVLIALIWALSTNEGSNFLRESQTDDFREFQELRDSFGSEFPGSDFNFEDLSPGIDR